MDLPRIVALNYVIYPIAFDDKLGFHNVGILNYDIT
jgi:hypothetical protein